MQPKQAARFLITALILLPVREAVSWEAPPPVPANYYWYGAPRWCRVCKEHVTQSTASAARENYLRGKKNYKDTPRHGEAAAANDEQLRGAGVGCVPPA
jgi:hypothetical protein